MKGLRLDRLSRNLLLFLVGFISFVLSMAWAEQQGLSRAWIGPIFLFATVMMYAAIGIYSRTTDAEEYYVAGRRIPAFYNGMATAADWMSAASFISLSGALYLQGFSGTATQPGGMAYVLGWTGGFCLVSLLIAPHLRRMKLYTVPDYFAERYGGTAPRMLAGMGVVLCSFTYVVAQIYGIGVIASRLTGVEFEIGILLGLGGVLLCSFLGGMRAITWTQVVQYIVMLLAFLIPVSWLAYKQLGNPVAPVAYGQQLARITALENELTQSSAEQDVRQQYLWRAEDLTRRLQNVPQALVTERERLEDLLRFNKVDNADYTAFLLTKRELLALPKDEGAARELWTRQLKETMVQAQALGGLPRHTQAFAGDPNGTPAEREQFQHSRLNFLALVFCLMLGTAAMPHLLTRYYTTPTVAAARASVGWSLFFIALLYISAPALATLVKFEVMQNLVGTPFNELPAWMSQWARVDSNLISVTDINGDGILQLGEIHLGADMIMLATPELGGLPYVVSGLVAAGGLAAALSTADGLILAISNALVRDMRRADVDSSPRRPMSLRSFENGVILSKFTLLAVAMAAAFVAALKPAEILALVTASFSLAAASLFPGLVLGIVWPRTTRRAVVAGMAAGLFITLYYMVSNTQWLRSGWNAEALGGLWWGIQPYSAGVFGVPVGFVVMALVSWLDRSGEGRAEVSHLTE